MPVSINNTTITFNDGTTQSTAASAGGVTSLNGQTGAITNTTNGVIGSYVAAGILNGSNTTNSIGNTVAGSTLRLVNGSGQWSALYMNGLDSTGSGVSNPGLTGTWRCMGTSKNSSVVCGRYSFYTNLLVRVS